eukprot:2363485-Rhodomonas_salina.1
MPEEGPLPATPEEVDNIMPGTVTVRITCKSSQNRATTASVSPEASERQESSSADAQQDVHDTIAIANGLP